MKNQTNPCARNSDVLTQDIAGETLVYDVSNNKAYCLNETSSLIWRLCDGRSSVNEIADQLSAKLKTLVSKEVVLLAIDQLNKDGLLEVNSFELKRFTGLSRREVILKAGLTSAIALPIISSMVAPTAVAAQSSCTTIGQTCDFVTPCCSGLFCEALSPGINFCSPVPA